MKLIVALFRPEHRGAVLDSVNPLDANVVSLTQVSDGGTPVISGTYRGIEVRTHGQRLRMELAVNDESVQEVIKAIGISAGGCHVLVMPLEASLPLPSVEHVQRSADGENRNSSLLHGVFELTP